MSFPEHVSRQVISELENPSPFEGNLVSDAENFMKDSEFRSFVEFFNKRIDEYKMKEIDFSEMVMAFRPDDFDNFFKNLFVFSSVEQIVAMGDEFFKRKPNANAFVFDAGKKGPVTKEFHEQCKKQNEALLALQDNMVFFFGERARMQRRDLSAEEALMIADQGVEAHVYALDLRLTDSYKKILRRNVEGAGRSIDNALSAARRVADQGMRDQYAKELSGHKNRLDELEKHYLSFADPGKAFNLMEKIMEFTQELDVLTKNTEDLKSKMEGETQVSIYDNLANFIKIGDSREAGEYLKRRTVNRLASTFAKWDRHFADSRRQRGEKYEAYKSLKEKYVDLWDKWLNEESGDLTDKEYSFVYSIGDILGASKELIAGKSGLFELFEELPGAKLMEDYVNEDDDLSKSKKISDLLKNSGFHSKFLLQYKLVEAEEEFLDLEMELFENGLTASLPASISTEDYGLYGTEGNINWLIDPVERMEVLYPLFKNPSKKASRFIRKYLSERIFAVALGRERTDDSESYERGNIYMEEFFKHIDGYDFNSIKNGAQHKMKLAAIRAQIEQKKQYWLDVGNGVFADGRTYESPATGLYLAMAALDDFYQVMTDLEDEYHSLVKDGYIAYDEDREEGKRGFYYYEGSGFTYLGPHHREIFNLIFPGIEARAKMFLPQPVLPQ